ncbi:MAG: hypothetical protein NUV80_04375 [Candidatus Berkelbacteria bacterium]|nr:hypothetical protein [Candidatus Berkelbacteria bacterium]MCR4307776.1 hypothetical protein [Candidatus Berkelbacteria bacterium]
MKDGPVPKLDWIPSGTVALRGRILLGVINDDQVDRWKDEKLIPADFDLSPFVAFCKPDGPDYADLTKTVTDLNEALIYHGACAKLRKQLRPTVFAALCREKGLDMSRARVVIVPDNTDCSRYVGRLIKRDSIELGSFRYNGNLTIELLEPYQAMEAKRDASKSGSRTQAEYLR